uniref:Putative conserved secreted protein n=1 Tax=Culex tarsalis TaxID=7177 RepID=A0A1Q3FR02_CULTA
MVRSVFLLAAVTLIQHSVAEQEVPGNLVKTRRAFADYANFCEATGHYVQCDSCSSYVVCLAGLQSNSGCPANKPFCNNNKCSAFPDYRACPVSSLNCTGTGFYPDPKACQFFHYCQAVGNQSDVYECPGNYVFNPETALCRRATNESSCFIVHCDPNKILQRFGNSTKYFAYCREQEILMAKCDDFNVFNGSRCVFECPKEGLFAHPDPARYYSCYFVGEQLVAQQVYCPYNRVFDSSRGVCRVPNA